MIGYLRAPAPDRRDEIHSITFVENAYAEPEPSLLKMPACRATGRAFPVRNSSHRDQALVTPRNRDSASRGLAHRFAATSAVSILQHSNCSFLCKDTVRQTPRSTNFLPTA
jgi:hypothetical protein